LRNICIYKTRKKVFAFTRHDGTAYLSPKASDDVTNQRTMNSSSWFNPRMLTPLLSVTADSDCTVGGSPQLLPWARISYTKKVGPFAW
jgi:hypothetical protein